MIEKLMEMLERVVVAMEKMADAKDKLAQQYAQQCGAVPAKSAAPAEEETGPASPDTDGGTGDAGEDDAAGGGEQTPALGRDAIKARLRELGVNFGERQATKTLTALLEAAESRLDADDETLDPGEESKCVACGGSGQNSKGGPCICQKAGAPEPEEKITKAALLTALKDHADKHGNASVREILQTVGKSSTLTDMDEANYAAVMAACQKGA